MASRSVDSRRGVLTLGRVDRVHVQVGFCAGPDDRPYQQFLLDLSVPETDGAREEDAFDERHALTALEPVLQADGAEAPWHYSLHQHRWHTSRDASPGALDLALLVTTGTTTTAISEASHDTVTRAFRDLIEMAGQPEPTPTSRDAAIVRARRAAATAYDVDPDVMSLSAEEHHPAENAWTVRLRTTAGDMYEVVVGFVDGYAGSVRVRHERQIEVSDSIGSE